MATALEAAAAGGHHLLLLGPPGAGKTMLAQRLPGLLPGLDGDVALETTMIHSAAGLALPTSLISRPPLRAPHHASLVAMVGGGTASMRPGRVSLASGGCSSWTSSASSARSARRSAPTVGRGGRAGSPKRASVQFPAVPARRGDEPCPCGAGGQPGACRCGVQLDSILRGSRVRCSIGSTCVSITRPAVDELLGLPAGEPSAVAAARVRAVRGRRRSRLRAERSHADHCSTRWHR